MNLDQIHSTVIPTSSVLFWVGAVVLFILIAIATGRDNPLWGVLFAVTVGVFVAIPGFYFMDEATNEAANASFHAELQKTYDLETDATYEQIQRAARDSKTVLLKDDNDVLEVRPIVNGDVLTFLLASDGKPVEKADS